jgi:hypothetical protein
MNQQGYGDIIAFWSFHVLPTMPQGYMGIACGTNVSFKNIRELGSQPWTVKELGAATMAADEFGPPTGGML